MTGHVIRLPGRVLLARGWDGGRRGKSRRCSMGVGLWITYSRQSSIQDNRSSTEDFDTEDFDIEVVVYQPVPKQFSAHCKKMFTNF